MVYNDIPIEQLLILVAKGDKIAYQTLIDTEIGYARGIAERLTEQYDFKHGFDDLVFVIYESLMKAINKYTFGLVPFHSYFKEIVTRDLIRYIKQKKNSTDILELSISFDKYIDNESRATLHDFINDSYEMQPTSYVNLGQVKHMFNESVPRSKEEKRQIESKIVIALKSRGYTTDEICEIVKKSRSHLGRIISSPEYQQQMDEIIEKLK